MPKVRILIIEDELLVAQDLRKSLHKLGYQVTSVVPAGEEAITKAKEDRPDLALMDIVLQGELSGIEAARQMRTKLDIPVIFITAYSEDKIVEEAKIAEPFGYVLKPIDEKKLHIAINIALGKHAAEKKLREDQKRTHLFLDMATDIFCILDRNLNLLEINKPGLDDWGYDEGQLLGQNFLAFIPETDRKRCRNELTKVMRAGTPFSADTTFITNRGERHINIRAFKAQDNLGLVIADRTDRKRAEQALKESEDRYKLLVENMNEGIAMMDADGVIHFVNDKFLDMEGYKKEEVLERPASEFVAPESIAFYNKRMNMIKKGQRGVYELTWRKKDGQKMTSIVSPSAIYDEKGNFRGSVAVFMDITERRQVEEELKRSREELRSLSRHLQSIRENESRRIAREIHDELGQALTALKMDVSWISQRLPSDDIDKKKFLDKINSMSKLIDKTIQTVQTISAELRPDLLDDLGLVAAIEWLAQDFAKRTGIKCRIDLDFCDTDLGADCSTAIFRIVQESLTNVARHAKASRVTISLREIDEKIELKIMDNGKGIRESEVLAQESLGLIGMRERLHPFDGLLGLEGVPNKGTTVSILIPIKKAKEK